MNSLRDICHGAVADVELHVDAVLVKLLVDARLSPLMGNVVPEPPLEHSLLRPLDDDFLLGPALLEDVSSSLVGAAY